MNNPLTLTAFADWCEEQGGQEYDFENGHTCACGQYAHELGLGNPFRSYDGGRPAIYSSSFWQMANLLAYRQPWTFAALAERCRR